MKIKFKKPLSKVLKHLASKSIHFKVTYVLLFFTLSYTRIEGIGARKC